MMVERHKAAISSSTVEVKRQRDEMDGLPHLARQCHVTDGSVSFRGKWYKRQTDGYQKLYQAAEIRSRSAATH